MNIIAKKGKTDRHVNRKVGKTLPSKNGTIPFSECVAIFMFWKLSRVANDHDHENNPNPNHDCEKSSNK